MQVNRSAHPRVVAACAFLICSASAGFAAYFGDFTYVEYDTYIEITGYQAEATADAVIPGEIVGKPVTGIGVQAFWGWEGLTSITIPDSVTSIGTLAFHGCTSLTSVTIPDSVTSIGGNAFWDCTSLTSITIPDSVTTIGEWAFLGCISLTAITVDATNPAYNSMDGVLFDKGQTTLLGFPQGRAGAYTIPESVTSIGVGAFVDCASLTEVIIPDGVTNIGLDAFRSCTSLTRVTIGNGVTGIGRRAFGNCTSLTSVTIPDSVTNIGDSAFSVCQSLMSVSIPDSVTNIGTWAFAHCQSLTSVTIGSGLTNIGSYVFFNCDSLRSVSIPNSVTKISSSAFNACTNLTAFLVDEGNSAYSSLDGVLFDTNQTTLINFPTGKGGSYTIPDSVTIIGFAAFGGCRSLTSVSISSSVTSIGVSAFEGCQSLKSVTIPDSVTIIGSMAFRSCTSLTSVTIPDSVTSIYTLAFRHCSNLRSVYFEGNAPIPGDGVFHGADNATVYYLPWTTGWGETYGDRPTEEAPLGGIPVDGLEGWFYSEWFGFYTTTLALWMFHAQHGFIFRDPASTNASLYFYDDAMGAWWWTSETYYPYIYAFDPPADLGGTDVGSEWLFYFEGSNDPRWFGVVTGVINPILSFDP